MAAVHAGIVQPCLKHLEQQTALQASSGAWASIQLPSSDLPLAVSYNPSSLRLMSSCLKARLRVLKAMSSHSLGSQQVQAVVHRYLAAHMPACRMQDSPAKEQPTVATAHLHLIHQVHQAHVMKVECCESCMAHGHA